MAAMKATPPMAKMAKGGIVEMKAALLHKADGGGVTGSGSLDLHIPLNAGGGGGGGSGGNSSVGLSSTPTGGGSAPTAGGSGQGLGGLLDSGRSFLGNTMTSHLMQNQSYDINKPAQGSNMPYIPAPQPSSPIAPPMAGSTPSSPIAAPMPTTPAPGNPNNPEVDLGSAIMPYVPAPGNPNNPEVDPGYLIKPYVPAPGNPNADTGDRVPGNRIEAPMPIASNGGLMAGLRGLIGGNTSGTPTPAPGNPNLDPNFLAGFLARQQALVNTTPASLPPEERMYTPNDPRAYMPNDPRISGGGSNTPSIYAKGGSVEAMKQELASKKAAGGTIKDYIRVTERPL
jgi:hypothetical protein